MSWCPWETAMSLGAAVATPILKGGSHSAQPSCDFYVEASKGFWKGELSADNVLAPLL